MTNSDSSKENTDSLSDKKNDETSETLKSIESFEDVYEMRRSKSSQEINNNSEEDNQPSCSTSKPEAFKSEADADSLYTRSVKHLSVHYSSSTYRMDPGEVRQSNGQQMDYHDYNHSQYPVCTGSCCWQPTARNGQDFNSGVPYGRDQMAPEMSNYSYGHATHSASDETIVNEPRASTSAAAAAENLRCSSNSCSFCCPMRQPGQQQTACYACDGGNPSQEHIMHMPHMPSMVVDPSSGYPFYSYPAPGSYPGMGMCSMPAMEVDQPQRAGAGQHNVEVSTSSGSGSQSSSMGCASPSMEGGANNQNPNSFDMEEFMHKYQKSLQQCYATAQQGLQQTFANGYPYFNQYSQGNQQYYAHSNQGTPSQMFAGSNHATPQYYDNTDLEAQQSLAYQRMQPAYSSHLNSQQYYGTSSLGAQSYLTPSMPMPASNLFGNNSGFISDTLHTQTVYSSDYKSFGNEGNHFNHFPNGIDIGLASESCPGYGPTRSTVLAEMGVGGQVYGMGGVGEMNMSSYPLSQVGYSTPYSYEMASPSSGHHGMGMANGGVPM